MGRKLKFGESTKVFRVRLPISKYDEMKNDINSLINRILKPLTFKQKLEKLRKSKLGEVWKKFIEQNMKAEEYNKEALKQMLEKGTKSQLVYRWRKWRKLKIRASMVIVFVWEYYIIKDKILKHKNLEKLGIDSYEDCRNKYGAFRSKEVMSKFSVNEVIENGKRIIKFLENQQELDDTNEIFENIIKLENYYDTAYLNNLYILSRINKENLDHCPHCLSAGEKKKAGKIDFDRLGRVTDRHKRLYERIKRSLDAYMNKIGMIRSQLGRLIGTMKEIEHCNEKIEMFRNAIDVRF